MSEASADHPLEDKNQPETPNMKAGYRVLARKYRPSAFPELIGQAAMVRTLTNAFSSGRIAQAYMLTGVRGVGKTTTARILARALNYETDLISEPTINFSELGVHCQSIMESHHPDVFEMDAASNTGIDDIREIIGYAQTRPSMARNKVFIIDEVHMLSRQAFNGLLKTLEEPPEHVRFIFATTESRKVPVTIMSRCQRFDLRRVETSELIKHFAEIVSKESAKAQPDALALIARAAEGSVRDGLSLLDQAIALGQGEVLEVDVRSMLGLADRGRVIDLFSHVMSGEISTALNEFNDQYASGADAQIVVTDLANFVHLITRAKFSDAALDDPSLTEAERDHARHFAAALSLSSLARSWQMLIKGLRELELASNIKATADMVLVRLAHASNLPVPSDVIRALANARAQPELAPVPSLSPSELQGPSDQGSHLVEVKSSQVASTDIIPDPHVQIAKHQPALLISSFSEARALASDIDIRLAETLEQMARPVSFSEGYIEIELSNEARPDIATRFAEILTRATGQTWVVSIAGDSKGDTKPDLTSPERTSPAKSNESIPLVSQIKDQFPGAEVVAVRDLACTEEDDILILDEDKTSQSA